MQEEKEKKIPPTPETKPKERELTEEELKRRAMKLAGLQESQVWYFRKTLDGTQYAIVTQDCKKIYFTLEQLKKVR